MLVIVTRAFRKFREDLLGTHLTIHTDHRTMEYFQGRRDSFRRQGSFQHGFLQMVVLRVSKGIELESA